MDDWGFLHMKRSGLGALFVVVMGGAFAGCGDVPVPLAFDTPSQRFDVTANLSDAEAELCADETSTGCENLKAFDRTDDGEVSAPPRLPDSFPASAPLPGGGEVSADELFSEGPLDDANDLNVALPVDIGAQLPGEAADAAKSLRLKAISLRWSENSLNFATVPLALYVSESAIADTSDPAELIASGAVKRVGTIEAQPQGVSTEQPVVFVDAAAEDKFNEALQSLVFTVVVGADSEVGLPADGDSGKFKRPDGVGDIAVHFELEYTLNVFEAAGQAQKVLSELQ
jgi:hypothetical protein